MRLLVNIDVADLALAEAFYTRAFDLVPARRFGGAALELTGAGCDIYLLHKPLDCTAAPCSIRDYTRHWTPIHCDVVVDDVDSALAQALDAGAVQEGPIREAAWGRIVQVADPFGHGWCLLQFLGRGYDEITP